MSASNGGDKGKRGKKFRPPARGKNDDNDDNDGQAALLAKCDKSSEEARRHLEEARRGPVRTRSKTRMARMEHGTTAAEKPRGKRYGILFSAYFSVKSCVIPPSGKFTQPVIHNFKLQSMSLKCIFLC